MYKSLESFLTHSLDYGGLLSRNLSVSEATQEYQHALYSSQSWILDRFVCPISHLVELHHYLFTLDLQEEWSLSIVSSGLEDFQNELNQIRENLKQTNFYHIDMIEIPIIEKQLNKKNLSFLNQISQEVAEIYIDIPLNQSMLDSLHLIAEYSSLSVKANITKESISPKILAQFLSECDHIDISFKLGDVLNAPYYGQVKNNGNSLYGFINILMVGALREVHELSQREVENLLCVQTPEDFHFTSQRFGWKNFTAPSPAIDSFRAIMTSFTINNWDTALSLLNKHHSL